VDNAIDWPAASAIHAGARSSLSAEAREAADRSPVPVLVVNQPVFFAASHIIAKPNFYALHTKADGVTISLSATRIAHRYEHIKPQEGPSRVRGKSAFVTQNDAIWSAAWNEHGAAYTLDVECGTLPDPRCDNERFVLELAESLAYVGGQGAGGTP
jgi:hypothetical protein